MKGVLKLGNNTFELNNSELYSSVFICDSEVKVNTYMLGVDVSFNLGIYDEQEVCPEFSIYLHETNVDDILKMVGMIIEMNDTHESRKREDVVYVIGENEAFEKYQIKILEVENGEMHLEIMGTMIKDIDVWPHQLEDFYMDVWLFIKYI